MKKLLILLTLVSSFAQAETINFKETGFSINALDQAPSAAGGTPLQMFLPPSNGFSANVNVQIQPYPGSMAEYIELSKSQLKQMGLQIIDMSISGDEAIFEYNGNMNGMHLHFYAKAVKKGSLFYLATATDLATQWHVNKGKLKNAVASFKLN